MAVYNIHFKPSVHKDLRSLPKDLVTRITTHIERLASTPISKQGVKLSNAECFFRIRVGDYRIVYEVDYGNYSLHASPS